ncbi:hypothetical protein MJA45_18825 [Paenibacillus aurantius]|uniref:Uncharacterized protein n=1 Tax=Paenibacillus aurantius TaxID=2918900 RepID=A0AA96L9L6_9BACL|nr:hypothetical protein [Paenibacillus aurantius]WNQ09669.1 hypothetical protein MJA45_18825 [Paenibacillus aurantius]
MVLFTTFVMVGCSRDVINEKEPELKDVVMALLEKENVKGNVFLIKDTENYLVAFFTDNSLGVVGARKINGRWQVVKRSHTNWQEFGFNVAIGDRLAQNENPPYIYFGTITDPAISKVTVGENEAQFFRVEENKKIWYYIDESSHSEEIKAFNQEGRKVFPGS